MPLSTITLNKAQKPNNMNIIFFFEIQQITENVWARLGRRQLEYGGTLVSM